MEDLQSQVSHISSLQWPDCCLAAWKRSVFPHFSLPSYSSFLFISLSQLTLSTVSFFPRLFPLTSFPSPFFTHIPPFSSQAPLVPRRCRLLLPHTDTVCVCLCAWVHVADSSWQAFHQRVKLADAAVKAALCCIRITWHMWSPCPPTRGQIQDDTCHQVWRCVSVLVCLPV